jgi:superfamily II DNA or RNA helicase
MVETIARRKSFDINDFDLVIVDEAHNLQFVKVIQEFKGRLLGFTATPKTDKVNYYETEDGVRWRQNVSLKKYYGRLITGVDTDFLIDSGYLVKDNYFLVPKDLSKLKIDSSGEFTNKSINEVYETKISAEAVFENYNRYSKNKKTLIFNNSIKTNDILFDYFNAKGVNVRKFDSNSKGRQETVDWFRQTRDAVLLNVGVFVAGFDVTDVETIILNRATNSLSLYLQMVGRGGRITNKIFKQSFNVIDLGGNCSRFGNWSSPRKWDELYSDDTIKKVQNDLEDVVVCEGCDGMILKAAAYCEFCGLIKPTIIKKVKKESFEIAVPVNEFKWCKASELVKYCQNNNFKINEAFRMVENMFIESVIHNGVKLNPKNNLEIVDAIHTRFRPFYFAIMGSNMVGNKKRKIMTMVYNIYDKIIKL